MRKLATYRDSPEQDVDILKKMKKEVFESETRDVAMTKTNVKKRPGWNEERLQKFLGAPDFTTQNSYRKYAETSWYLTKRVQKAENYKTFQKEAANAIAQHDKRKKAARKAVETKKEKTYELAQERLNEVKIKKKYANLKKNRLYDLAVDHYNALHEYRAMERGNYYFEYVTKGAVSEDFLERIAVNFLRHDCTTYDDELEEYFNRVGKHEAINMVRQHVYKQISQCYPYLEKECKRQLLERGIIT